MIIVFTFFSKIKRYISISVYFPLALLLYLLNIKVPFFNVDRIGHLLVEPDSFVKEYILKNDVKPKAIFLAPLNEVANKRVVECWKKYFLVIQNPILCKVLMPLAFHPLLAINTKKYAAVMDEAGSSFLINNQWGDKNPLFSLNKSENKLGLSILNEIGVRPHEWFVCIHNREAGYDLHQDPEASKLHNFRNFPCSDLFLAADYINSIGGVCIRMGDNNMKPVSHKGIIDYALSSHRSEFMDLYLGSKAKFFLGSTSGACNLSFIFGVPIANVNMSPITSVTYGVNDISIPMLVRNKKTKERLSFSNILSGPLANIRTSEGWEKTNFELERNTPEDILELTKEQLQRIDKQYHEDPKANILNQKLKSLYQPRHYCYGASSKMGDHFIKKYF